MRVYWKQPSDEVRIVRPDNSGDEYEVWMLRPVLIGSMTKINNRILVDGQSFTNLNAGARHILERAGEPELAKERRIFVKQGEKVTMTGLDLVERGAWVQFCQQRQLSARSTEDMQKVFQLTKQELAELGIKQ
jgi:hypothetical protein